MSGNSQRVLIVVANDIRSDTRVLKSALALADAKHQVTILGLSTSDRREDAEYGPVRIIRIPVAWRMRDLAQKRQQHFVNNRITPEPRTQRDISLDSLRTNTRVKELQETGSGWRMQTEVVANKLWDRVGRRGIVAFTKVARRIEGKARRETVKIGRQIPLAASWRRDLPELVDYHLAYAPIIDSLEWDIIHTHEVHLLATAAAAVNRRRRQGQVAHWVHDVDGVVDEQNTRRDKAAYVALQRRYIGQADAVIAATEALAEQLQQRYRLTDRPTVVMDIPEATNETTDATGPTVRDLCGLDEHTPLLVYCGDVTPAHGVNTVIESLVQLTKAHLAVVTADAVTSLREVAESLTVDDRVHFLDVPSQLSSSIASADVAVYSLRHGDSHQFLVPHTLVQYLRAGLPLVVSDCQGMSTFVRDNDLGAVFRADDATSCAAAVGEVMGRREFLGQRIADVDALLEPYSWPSQAHALIDVYSRLTGTPAVETDTFTSVAEVREKPLRVKRDQQVLGIGPANFAGQAWQWARALEKAKPDMRCEVVAIDTGNTLTFQVDTAIPVVAFNKDPQWAHDFADHILSTWSHALFEAVKPLLGSLGGNNFTHDTKRLLGAGIGVGVIFHGSELRNPARHAARHRWSPFADPNDSFTAALQRQAEKLFPMIDEFIRDQRGPAFVSTPDLLDDLPSGIWLPLVVDAAQWHSDRPVLEDPRPLVVHAPTNAALKGTDRALAALQELDDEGVIQLRHLERVPPTEMPAQLAQADIILDQFALGSYGALAVESMAAGRLVFGHVTDEVRDHVRTATGEELPIVEATIDNLADTMRSVLAERDHFREVAARGSHFVRSVHDGRLSSQVIAEHMEL